MHQQSRYLTSLMRFPDPMMNSFFDLLYHSSGKLNQTIFDNFFYSRFAEGLNFFTKTTEQVGDFTCWSLHDLLMVHGCAVGGGLSTDIVVSNLPPPPHKEEFLAIGQYQRAHYAASIRGTKRPMMQPPDYQHFSKSIRVGELGLKYNRSIFVETGTFTGLTPYTVANLFKSIYTVEADAFLHRNAETLFKNVGFNHIKCICGDSPRLIEVLRKEQPNPNEMIFFLDAHYSSGITSQKFGLSPLQRELEILLADFPGALIVVDDARAMGEEGYPSIHTILNMLKGNYTAEISFDQIVLAPLS